MEAGAAHQRRADTGFSTAELGVLLILAADAMFFGALFSSYAFLRTAAADWPAQGHEALPLGWDALGLAALVLSACACASAWAKARIGQPSAAAGVLCALGAALHCACLLLGKLALSGVGVRAATSTYYAIEALLGELLAFQAGIAGLAALWIVVRGGGPGSIRTGRIGLLSLYLNFLAMIGIIEFLLFYAV